MPESPRTYYPEDRLPLLRLVPMGLQHVVAMFGATVLAPLFMGFDPQVAVFFSGVGTLIFVGLTACRVPSYLGSSFAFIGPVVAVTRNDPARIPLALCGIAAAAVLYGGAAAVTMRWGSSWIDRLMPPVVTGSVVALIGLNLASSAIGNAINDRFTLGSAGDVANLVVAGSSIIVATGLGVKGVTIGSLNLAGIAVGTLLAMALNVLLSLGRDHGPGRPQGNHPRQRAGDIADGFR